MWSKQSQSSCPSLRVSPFTKTALSSSANKHLSPVGLFFVTFLLRFLRGFIWYLRPIIKQSFFIGSLENWVSSEKTVDHQKEQGQFLFHFQLKIPLMEMDRPDHHHRAMSQQSVQIGRLMFLVIHLLSISTLHALPLDQQQPSLDQQLSLPVTAVSTSGSPARPEGIEFPNTAFIPGDLTEQLSVDGFFSLWFVFLDDDVFTSGKNRIINLLHLRSVERISITAHADGRKMKGENSCIRVKREWNLYKWNERKKTTQQRW